MPKLIKQLMQAGLAARGTLHIMVKVARPRKVTILCICEFFKNALLASLAPLLPSKKRFIPAEAVGALEAHIVCDVCDHVFAVVKQERRGTWVRSKKLICVMLC